MFDPRKSVSSSLEPTTNLGVEFSPSLEVVRDDIAASVADHPALESECAKRDREGQTQGEPGAGCAAGGRGWQGGKGAVWHEWASPGTCCPAQKEEAGRDPQGERGSGIQDHFR